MKLFMKILLFIVIISNVLAQQVSDTLFQPIVERPLYSHDKGPVVFIDEAHNNFHTMGGRYQAFARVLQCDGYIVRPSRNRFNADSLRNADILVISNALHEKNIQDWSLPTPSAFTKEEIEKTPRISVAGWFQGAVKPFRKGRIAIFGEAAMFTAQRSGSGWFGLKSAGAEQNQQFLLNIMHWLSGEI